MAASPTVVPSCKGVCVRTHGRTFSAQKITLALFIMATICSGVRPEIDVTNEFGMEAGAISNQTGLQSQGTALHELNRPVRCQTLTEVEQCSAACPARNCQCYMKLNDGTKMPCSRNINGNHHLVAWCTMASDEEEKYWKRPGCCRETAATCA
eukprot:TRINITY_DN38448_c0_g1_i1.p1 TRINITY_DN38448_c0_g1~~TRINITY_DN38448_c0_g1_i1.p1  ORF type:complete len:153 (+),score=11.55 TRINITY_DN38448_c0_g1_i1:103-561(+)